MHMKGVRRIWQDMINWNCLSFNYHRLMELHLNSVTVFQELFFDGIISK